MSGAAPSDGTPSERRGPTAAPAADADPARPRRVLLLAPTARDAAVTCKILLEAGLSCMVCRSLGELAREIEAGAGAVVMTEEGLASDGMREVIAALERQPPWSDLPVVVVMRGSADQPSGSAGVVRSLRNVTLLERPAPMRSIVSAVQTAVRSRDRQYQIRDQIETVRAAEAEARRFQQQLQLAVDASDLGTFHCPIPLGRIDWNDRCKAHFWLPPDAEIDFDLFYAIIHPDDRARTRRAIEACVSEGKFYDIEYRTVSPTGSVRWVRATGRTYYDAGNRPLRFDGTTQDITERKRAEEELRVSRERLQAMADSIPQLAWMANADGWIFWYNRRWHEYCGTTARDMEGWGWQKVQDPRELPRVVEKWKASLAAGTPWEDTFPLRRHDGQFRWHLSRAMPFRDADGNVTLWFGTNTDVTEQRERDEERQALLESERAARTEAERASRMKDEFLATLSHELRTPLNAIFGWTQLLKAGKDDPETIDQAIDVIDRNVRLQTQLIEDLLDMSRIISGKIRLDVQRVDVGDVVNAALDGVRPAAEARGLRLEKVVDPNAGPVSGDPGRLQQVLWNLLTNAIKFTPRGGRVHVLAERVDSHVEVSVTDTGDGIDPGFLPFLFERFRQADGSTKRKHGGLGLGLSIVKSLVEMHGGAVRAASDGPGRGATFTVTLPLRATHGGSGGSRDAADDRHDPSPRPASASAGGDGAAAAVAGVVDCEPPVLRGVKVLVVDDEPDAREMVRRLLVGCEAVPAVAGSAGEARELLQSFRPDVILSDIGMPHTDGYEFMRDVRRQGVKTPAVALTAFARAEDRIRSIQAGYQIHLPKPVEPAELLAVLASLSGRLAESPAG